MEEITWSRDEKMENEDTAIFHWMSKVIQECTGFHLLRSMIGPKNFRYLVNPSGFAYLRATICPENFRYLVNQSDANWRQIASCFLRFPAFWVLACFNSELSLAFDDLSSLWLVVEVTLVLVVWNSRKTALKFFITILCTLGSDELKY